MNKYEKTKRRENSYKRIKKIKEAKGITLIALVITIVILIILSVVTINMAFGDNGLVKYADKAKFETEKASAQERLEIVLQSAYAEKKTNTEYSEEEFLNQHLDEYIYSKEPKAVVDGEIISLNGFKFELDRSVPQLGKYIEKTEDVSTNGRILTSEIKTNSIKIKVQLPDTENEIEKIEYSEFDGNVYYTGKNLVDTQYEFKGLSANTEYKIKVKVTYKSNEVTEISKNIKTNKEIFSDKYIEAAYYTDSEGNTARIPQGFAVGISEGINKISTGLVITDNINENNESIGNEFVWVPATVDGKEINIGEEKTVTIKYQRTNFESGNFDYSYFRENRIAEDDKSVNSYGGFYISRYEAGDIEATNNKTMRENGSNVNNTMVIRKNQVPYTWINKNESIILAESMATENEYVGVYTKLISSYAWDTTLNFIEARNAGYLNNPMLGNYLKSVIQYKDLSGDTKIKKSEEALLLLTGQTYSASNIYDIAGNAQEITSETNITNPKVIRGASYGVEGERAMPGDRSATYSDLRQDYITFRVTLYIK